MNCITTTFQPATVRRKARLRVKDAEGNRVIAPLGSGSLDEQHRAAALALNENGPEPGTHVASAKQRPGVWVHLFRFDPVDGVDK